MEQVTKEMQNLMHNIFHSDMQAIVKYDEDIEQLKKVLDPMLDKALRNDPHFTCGDFLERLQEFLADLWRGIDYANRAVVAKATAWSLFPEKMRAVGPDEDLEDVNENYRHGYMMGFMQGSAK